MKDAVYNILQPYPSLSATINRAADQDTNVDIEAVFRTVDNPAGDGGEPEPPAGQVPAN
jgi:hypothetical protein